MATSENTAARAAPATSTALATLAAYQDFHGRTPFGGVDSVHASTRCGDLLSQAASILSFMAAAYADTDGFGKTSEVQQRSARTIAAALEGVESLIHLADFLVQEGE